ncbi:hypothetical protein COB11_08385 [Candidatus Aerophobetes bacterium]|uniref:Uncharacterized protein n=1 Tax=Aerophobetes bacterium TaxID=2030807 RepID=A0A2A4Y9Q2_UNCAE|nr:MAG: hypothetical protein COB11_08385 [Candidatus Aerophobetes bacterium]
MDGIILQMQSALFNKEKPDLGTLMKHFLLMEVCNESDFESSTSLACFHSFESYRNYAKDLNTVVSNASFYSDDLTICDCTIIDKQTATQIHEQNQCLASKDTAERSQFLFNVVSQRLIGPISEGEDTSFEAFLAKHTAILNTIEPNKKEVIHILVEMCKRYLDDERLYKCLVDSEIIILSEFFYAFMESGMYKEAMRYVENSGEHSKSFLSQILLEAPAFVHQYPSQAVRYLSLLKGEDFRIKYEMLMDFGICKKDLNKDAIWNLVLCMQRSSSFLRIHTFMDDFAKDEERSKVNVYADYVQMAMENSEYSTVLFLLNSMKSETFRKNVYKTVFATYSFSKCITLVFYLFTKHPKNLARQLTFAMCHGDPENRKSLKNLAGFCSLAKTGGKLTDVHSLKKCLFDADLGISVNAVLGLVIYYINNSRKKIKINTLKTIVSSIPTKKDRLKIYNRAHEALLGHSRVGEAIEVGDLIRVLEKPSEELNKAAPLELNEMSARKVLQF